MSAPTSTHAPTQFETASIEVTESMDEASRAGKRFTLSAELQEVLGLPKLATPYDAQSKTQYFPQTPITLDSTGALAATLDQMTVTVTKMSNPSSGAPMLLINFSYLVTSDGRRTGQNPGETVDLDQGLFFLNSSGGTMYSWGFPWDGVIIRCGWNGNPSYHVIREYQWVDWFDLWASTRYSARGLTYPC
jgi:hypothetical protein